MAKRYIGKPDVIVVKCPVCKYDVAVNDLGLIESHQRLSPGTRIVFGEKPSTELCPDPGQTGILEVVQNTLI